MDDPRHLKLKRIEHAGYARWTFVFELTPEGGGVFEISISTEETVFDLTAEMIKAYKTLAERLGELSMEAKREAERFRSGAFD